MADIIKEKETKVVHESDHHKDTTARTLGVIGTIGTGLLAAGALSKGGFGWFNGNGCGRNVDDQGYGCGCGTSAFNAYSKECQDILDLTNAMWGLKVNTMTQAKEAREVDVAEKFSLWKSQVDADFGLYKSTRDGFDVLNNRFNREMFEQYKYTRDSFDKANERIAKLETDVAVNASIRPYQDKLIMCKMQELYDSAINYVDRKTCKMLTGVVTLPTEPQVTGLVSYCCGNRNV